MVDRGCNKNPHRQRISLPSELFSHRRRVSREIAHSLPGTCSGSQRGVCKTAAIETRRQLLVPSASCLRRTVVEAYYCYSDSECLIPVPGGPKSKTLPPPDLTPRKMAFLWLSLIESGSTTFSKSDCFASSLPIMLENLTGLLEVGVFSCAESEDGNGAGRG